MGITNSAILFDEQIFKAEVEVIQQLELCPNIIDKNNSVHNLSKEFEGQNREILLDRINTYSLKEQLDERFYDARLMSVISCVYGNLWLVDKKLFKATDSIKSYFKFEKNYSSGVEGLVMLGERENFNVVIKTHINQKAGPLILHEIFIGLVTTNKLRAYCPNFAFIYGGFVCGSPNIVNGNICQGNIDVPYVVYENIEGQSLHNYMTKGRYNPLEVLAAILQIYFALNIAKSKGNNFAHRDCHGNNIILRPLKTKMAIKYQIGNKVYYVYSSYVATLIDYGSAEVYFKNQKGNDVRFGNLLNLDYNGHIKDLGKLIGFTAYIIGEDLTSKPFKEFMTNLYFKTLYPWRPTKPYVKQLEELSIERANYFNPTQEQEPYIDAGILNFDHFIDVVKRVFPSQDLNLILTEQDPKFPLLECDEKCLTLCETFSKIFEFKQYKMGSTEAAVNLEDSSRKFRNDKDYQAYIDRELEELKAKSNEQLVKAQNELLLIKLNSINLWLNNPLLPKVRTFDQKDNYLEIEYYIDRINSLFEFVKLLKDAIQINNGITILQHRSIYKTELINLINRVLAFWKSTIVPLKQELYRQADLNFLGDLSNEFRKRIVDQIPEKLNLNPVQ